MTTKTDEEEERVAEFDKKIRGCTHADGFHTCVLDDKNDNETYKDRATEWVRTTLTARDKAHAEAEERGREEAYLSHFSYEDWETGDDDKLRVGDYINLNQQRAHDGHETNIRGKIVLHHSNNLPIILEQTKDESGDYLDIQTAFIYGYTFTRLTPTP